MSEILVKFVGPDGSPLGSTRSGHVPRNGDAVRFDDGDILRVTGVLWDLDNRTVTLRMNTLGVVL